MNALIRCPHCTHMTQVETADNWSAEETLFTVCAKCDMAFMMRKSAQGLKVFKDLALPKPTRSKLKTVTHV